MENEDTILCEECNSTMIFDGGYTEEETNDMWYEYKCKKCGKVEKVWRGKF